MISASPCCSQTRLDWWPYPIGSETEITLFRILPRRVDCMQTFFLTCLFLLSILLPALADAPRADFYVATNGNDTWTGKLPAPNATRTDGPFATPQRARQAVLELHSLGKHKGPIAVQMR